MLDEIGVNIIEGGFASVSEGDFQALKLMAKENLKAEVCSMARANLADIDAVIKTEVPGVHIVVPTSKIHLEYKLKMTMDEVLNLTVKCIDYAKKHGLIVELSAEDGSRSDVNFLKRFFSLGADSGADRVCLCDTVGILTPERSYELVAELCKNINIPFGIHCHNDFGLATVNTLAAVKAGANHVHVTVNGLGERAGNAALEEVVMVLSHLYGFKLSLKTEKLYELSRTVSRLTGIPVQPNKAIVGDNAFTHESGIHTKAILSYPLTYEPLNPETVGFRRRFIVGKHAGLAGVKAMLEQLDIYPTEEQLAEIFRRVKSLGDKGKTVTDSDLQAIAEAVMGVPQIRPIKLKGLTVTTGDRITPTASVRLEVNGQEFVEAGVGVGPVDAAINAIKKVGGAIADVVLEEYHVKSITGGTNAVVEVIVRLRKGDRIVTASGAHEDIVMASVEAVLSGMNTLLSTYLNKNKK
jgi:D-citramalate synthase